MFIRTPTAIPSPSTERIPARISRMNRLRPSRSPPYSSVRLLVAGERKRCSRSSWLACSSITSRPAATDSAAEKVYSSTNQAISARVSTCGTTLL